MSSVSDFSFQLPPVLIAQYPLPGRTESRLLSVDKKTGKMEHHYFHEIINFLHPGDLLVLNNTRVLPARLFGSKISGGKISLLIHELLNEYCALAFVKTSKPLKSDTHFFLESGERVEVQGKEKEFYKLKFSESLYQLLHTKGHIPLPPYIHREDELFDRERYQTVYAQHLGAVAAPTAGLHFDENLLGLLQKKGIEIGYLTLHVGAGTFQPIRQSDYRLHIMHKETVDVSSILCEQINRAKKNQKRVIAVGTTSVRGLETASATGELHPYHGETQLFIYPPYNFHCVDALITNFHLPESTLLMLVCAFGGYTHIMEAYHLAINNQYRFFSYGDAMFIS